MRKENTFLALAICATIALVGAGTAHAVSAKVNTETHTDYIICDVISTSETDNLTLLTVEMQTGDVEVFWADDVPEDPELVCFKTENIDDFTSYEIVAIR